MHIDSNYNNNLIDSTEININDNFEFIKKNFSITDKSKIINELDNNNDNNKCIICWCHNGNTILCLNCKFKYCDECVKKVNSKCCICYRNNKKYFDVADDEFGIYYNSNFNTTIFTIITGSTIIMAVYIGTAFIFITMSQMIIKYLMSKFFYIFL